jgi:hypothetical protein
MTLPGAATTATAAAAAAAAATTTATTASSATTFGSGIDPNGAPIQFAISEGFHGRTGLIGAGKSYKAEATGPTGLTITNDLGFHHLTVRLKVLLESFISGGPCEAAYKKLVAHSKSPTC